MLSREEKMARRGGGAMINKLISGALVRKSSAINLRGRYWPPIAAT